MKKHLLSLLSLALLAVLIQPAPARAGSKIDQAVQLSFAQLAAQIRSGPAESSLLEVASAQAVVVLDLAYEAYRVKIFDRSAVEIHTFWYDADLASITEEQAFASRAAAYQNRYGKLSRELYQSVSEIPHSAAADIPVAVWANQFPAVESSAPGPSYPFKMYLPLVRKPGPVEDILAFLSSRGYTPDYISDQAPVVYVTLPTALVNELQAQSYVAAIYPQSEGFPSMESAGRTAAAPWTWERGITGSGVKVAVLENDGVAFDNPYLDGSKYAISWWPRVGDHATEVAGVIASTHASQRGISYGAEILSANALTYGEPMIISAADWAIDQGVDVINASFGTICGGRNIQSIDKYFDWVVWNKKKTVVVAAGNLRDECTSNYNVSSPGKGYNVITVGAKNDQNTATSTGDVADDVFSYFSLYVDPDTASENRLKPEVVATGQRIRSTSTSSPWITTSEIAGTSFAAPIVAGEAALMMQRSSWLKYSPEAVKAGIMSTARWTRLHDDKNYSQWASLDKMGVGAVDVTAADNSLLNNRTRELYLKQSDFTNSRYDLVVEGCPQGERFRTVIAWPSHPSRTILNWILHDRLESDFDLTVQAHNGQIYGSYADEANYEIVEFVSPQTGSATIRIHLSRWDNASVTERIGLSYYCGSPID